MLLACLVQIGSEAKFVAAPLEHMAVQAQDNTVGHNKDRCVQHAWATVGSHLVRESRCYV